MISDIAFWELAVFGVALAYIISVLLIRTETSHRKSNRRQNERRLCPQVVAIERRQDRSERRSRDTRA